MLYRRCSLAIACLLACAASLAAQSARAAAADAAKGYPSRPIRMVIPFAPGGASDFIARIIQSKLSDELGQRVVADNRAGAAGNIGVEIAARAAPDGHTLLLGNLGPISINPSVYPKFPVNPARDLVHISLVADVPGVLGVHPSIPVTTVREFIAHAEARPGKLNYGSAGVTSAQRLMFEVFMRKTGIRLMHIAYKDGGGAATMALLGGEIAASIAAVNVYLPHVKSGKIKPLAVIAVKRLRQLPDTQTFAEQGFPEWVLGSWYGVHAPAATPKPIVGKLYTALIKTLNDPSVIERINAGGVEVASSKSPAEYGEFIRAQTALWAKTVKDVGDAAE